MQGFAFLRKRTLAIIRDVDWRIWAVVATLTVLIVSTTIVYMMKIGRDPSTHFGSVFAAWVAGVAIFVVSGSIISIVSLVRPEHESFDARARILFRRQTGQHIDYIISRIKEILEHYSEQCNTRITLLSYDKSHNMYRVRIEHDVSVRSYLDDVTTTYHSYVKYSEMTKHPEGKDENRLLYVRIDDKPIVTSAIIGESFERPVQTTLDKDASCMVSSAVEHWMRADDESYEHTTRRYTQLINLSFENLVSNESPVKIRIKPSNGPREIEIRQGESKAVLTLRNINPGVAAYEFYVMSP
jgi:hypothetical protein